MSSQGYLRLYLALCVTGLAPPSCTVSHRDAPSPSADDPGEDPAEERGETPAQELAEEQQEHGSGGSPGAGGSAGGGVAGASGPLGSGGTAATGSLLTGGTANASAGASGPGGGNPANGGAPGASGSPSSAGAGGGGAAGISGGGAAGISGGGTAGSGPTSFPPLDPSQIGRPSRIGTTPTLTLAEGPLWDPCAHRLLFVDVTASTIYSMTSDDQVSVFAQNTGNTNGIAFDLDGSLIMAQMARPGHIARRDKSGNVQVINPTGVALHTPDDVVVRSDGTIYFTDGEFPPVGTINLGPLPVYGFKPGAAAMTNGGSVRGPNGIELSPDEKTLYVDAYSEGSVYKFPVAPDGSFTKGATLITGLVNPDSLCVDAGGNLYVGVSTGLQVLRPDGTRVVLIPIASSQGVTNCEFGGDDGKTLYITAWTGVWKISGMPIPGLQWSENRQRLGCM